MEGLQKKSCKVLLHMKLSVENKLKKGYFSLILFVDKVKCYSSTAFQQSD